MRGAIAVLLAGALGGCTYRTQSQADCLASHVPHSVKALPEILALTDPPPRSLEAGFTLCSTHEDRLAAAGSKLGAEGYSSYIGVAELGRCLRVVRTLDASVPALEREISTMCRIAAASRVAYLSWSAEVGGRSVTVDGKRMWIAVLQRDR